MQQAVIRVNGSQYLVKAGDQILLPLQDQTEGQIKFEEVLMTIADKDVQVGQPTVVGAKVTGTVLGMKKGEKVRVFKYKAKSRYRKTRGFRAKFTLVKIDEIA